MDIKLKKVITPLGRVSFPQVFKAKAFRDQEAKFSMTLIFEATTDLTAMKTAVLNAGIEKWGEDRKKWPSGLKLPFKKGDDKADKVGYGPGKIYISATSKTQPGLVNAQNQPILNQGDFYAGCWARAELIAFAYDIKDIGSRGISFSLQNIRKERDDTPFSGKKSAEDAFADIAPEGGGADDPLSYGDTGTDDAMGLG